MELYRDIREARLPGPTFLTIGNFDGVHRGHQALLRRLLEAKAQSGLAEARTAVMTFDPHPLQVLRPEAPVRLLTTPEERMEMMAELGMDVGIIQPFTRELAELSPEAFVQMLVDHLGLAGLVVGPDFALGRGRRGTVEVLRELGQRHGFQVHVVHPITWQGQEVRSFTLRQLIQSGEVAQAMALLTRPYRLKGTVVRGDGRGRQIGVPTANLRVDPLRLLPGDGVYATWTWVGGPPGEGHSFPSVTNIGVRPTVDGRGGRQVEVHLLDFPPPGQDGDLYGQELTVEFIARLRDEQRFPSLDALVAQIRRDVERARDVLREPTTQVPGPEDARREA